MGPFHAAARARWEGWAGVWGGRMDDPGQHPIKNKNKKNLHTKYIAYKKHTPNVVMLLPHPRKRTRYIIVRKIYIMRTMYML